MLKPTPPWLLLKMRNRALILAGLFLGTLYCLPALAWASGGGPMVPFYSLKETVAKLLPQAEELTRRDIELSPSQQKRLRKFNNWDTQEIEFVLYHAKNENRKITRTLILFPEKTRQGTLVLAVSIDNQGRIIKTLIMEAQQATMQGLMPVVRTGYLETFSGKDRRLPLKLSKSHPVSELPAVSQTYALRIANAVKKSTQLFHVFFNRP